MKALEAGGGGGIHPSIHACDVSKQTMFLMCVFELRLPRLFLPKLYLDG